MSTISSVFDDTIKQNMAVIWPYMEDSQVSEILINGPDEIFIEKKGKLEKTEARFSDDDVLLAAVNSIAQSVGRRINEENPRLDARLKNGSRIAAVIRPCSLKGTIVSIRKFTQAKINWAEYVKLALSPKGAMFLAISMRLGKNIIVSGGTGSGKTTLLTLLCGHIPSGQRLIVIEDSNELKINYEHVVFFETRQADAQGKGEVSMKDLLKSSLRLRPDRIIVGEVRSSEAIELINAMNTGHKGCMGTVHANSPEDAIVRLEALAQSGDAKISEKALRSQVSSAVEIIVQISRLSDGSRRVTEISEIRGFNPDGSYNVVPIFKIPRLVKKGDKLEGTLVPTGNKPLYYTEIIDNNLLFDKDLFTSVK
ncbi:MAG: CpaF family protein [Bdellovibrionales bacterium]|nr:CpaF family protein [Bdellovibrionales bacterium]